MKYIVHERQDWSNPYQCKNYDMRILSKNININLNQDKIYLSNNKMNLSYEGLIDSLSYFC